MANKKRETRNTCESLDYVEIDKVSIYFKVGLYFLHSGDGDMAINAFT